MFTPYNYVHPEVPISGIMGVKTTIAPLTPQMYYIALEKMVRKVQQMSE